MGREIDSVMRRTVRTVFLVVTLLLGSSLAMDCPMVGLDCLFHDIQRAADAGSWQECAVPTSTRTAAGSSLAVPSPCRTPPSCLATSPAPHEPLGLLRTASNVSSQRKC